MSRNEREKQRRSHEKSREEIRQSGEQKGIPSAVNLEQDEPWSDAARRRVEAEGGAPERGAPKRQQPPDRSQAADEFKIPGAGMREDEVAAEHARSPPVQEAHRPAPPPRDPELQEMEEKEARE